ncbi:hypothetical protein HanIR_Chr07g0318901 [Helianthus annuus]|nr:hypothetical protein HanIR_Chr07g0318901 [Helianthus annuus]
MLFEDRDQISRAYSKTIQIKAESSPLLSSQSLLQMLKNDSCISSRTIHIIKVRLRLKDKCLCSSRSIQKLPDLYFVSLHTRCSMKCLCERSPE